jgi:hypothetical protein
MGEADGSVLAGGASSRLRCKRPVGHGLAGLDRLASPAAPPSEPYAPR